MGAEEFYTESHGANVQDAFDLAVEQAQYEHGHEGYSGTIAEKDSYVLMTEGIFATADLAKQFAEDYMRRGPSSNPDETTVYSKWGPAGAVRFYIENPGEPDQELQSWLFFGVASS